MAYKKRRTKYCKHPLRIKLDDKKFHECWCHYCRMRAFHNATDEQIEAAYKEVQKEKANG
jgi:hypothetical protein